MKNLLLNLLSILTAIILMSAATSLFFGVAWVYTVSKPLGGLMGTIIIFGLGLVAAKLVSSSQLEII